MSATVLPGNLLSATDSDFESGTTTWTASTNAGTPALSATTSFSGAQSLKWTATAAGDTAVASGFCPCVPNDGILASGYISPSAARSVKLGIAFYTSGGTQIGSTQYGPVVSAGANTFAPVYVLGTSPATAAKFKVIAYVVGAALSEAEYLDLVYTSNPSGVVLIDWYNPAFGNMATGGNDFVDATPFVRWDVGITTNRGRQDNISDVQTGSATFALDNNSGWFTPSNANSPYYGNITLGRRVQINVPDQTGAWHVRFDGALSPSQYQVDQTGNTNQFQATAQDVLWFLNRQIPLSCWTKNQILNEPSLLYHWSLNDDGKSGLAAESSGNGGPPLRLKSWGTGGAVNWQGGQGGVETLADAVTISGTVNQIGQYSSPLASVNFTPAITTGSTFNDFTHVKGYSLQARLPTPLQTNSSSFNWTLEAWFMLDPGLSANGNKNTGPFTVLSLGDSTTGYTVAAGLYTQPAGFVAQVSAFSQPPSFVGTSWGGVPTTLAGFNHSFTSDTIGVPHHLVITIAGASTGGTLSAYVDGVNMGSFVLSKKRVFDWLCVGGAYGGYGCWDGNISLVSLYNSVLSSTDVSSHLSTGQIGNFGLNSDTCINNLVTYGNIPSYWNGVTTTKGLTITDYLDTTGANALTTMQVLEQVEQGFLFVDATGNLRFHTRDWRMGYGAADLTLPTDVYTPDLGYSLTDQFQYNIAAYGTAIFSSGASAINSTSDNAYGDYENGDPSSPNQVPLPAFAVGYAQMGIQQYAYWGEPYLTDLSNWVANSKSSPGLLCTSATVDLLTLDPTSGITISQLYALDIDNMITLAGLPANMATDPFSNDFFIEGIAETIKQGQWELQFFTSPAQGSRCWKPGDSTYGVLGSTAKIGWSQSSTHATAPDSKNHDWEPGPVYWPPSFSTTMNNPSNNGHDFVGANDIRGLTWNLNQLLNPPLCIIGQVNNAQAIANNSTTVLAWDTIYADTLGGMGFIPAWPNWYCCLQPGYYEIDLAVVWAVGTTSFTVRSAIVVAEDAAQAVLLGTGNPTTVNQAASINSHVATTSSAKNNICDVSQQIYLGLGDMISCQVWQDSGASYSTGTNYGGSLMSIRWVGVSTSNDQWT